MLIIYCVYFFNCKINSFFFIEIFNYCYNFLIYLVYKSIISLFFCHISFYVISFIFDYFKEYKFNTFFLIFIILISGFKIYLFFLKKI
jgi:hypothetical protein